MDKELEQTLLQRTHKNGQQVYENMLNITNHNGKKEMQVKTNEINLTAARMAIIKKKNVSKNVEELETLYTVGQNRK